MAKAKIKVRKKSVLAADKEYPGGRFIRPGKSGIKRGVHKHRRGKKKAAKRMRKR